MRKAPEGFQELGPYTVTRELRRSVPLEGEGTGFTTVPAGEERVTFKLLVDVERIAKQLGHRAAQSRRGQARAMAGALRAKVIERIR